MMRVFEKYKVHSSILVAGIALNIFLTACATNALAAINQEINPPPLFNDANAAGTFSLRPEFVRYRFVTVNTALLLNNGRAIQVKGNGTEILLNLFPNVSYIAVVDKVEQNEPDSTFWIGHLKNTEFGQVSLVIENGIFTAHISSPEGVYEVYFCQDDLYEIVEIDQSKFPND